ncbi:MULTISPECIES: RNA polymerase sigma factor [unclassified Parafrankia]|uniref:RNA polymerase sigma factor n=1 Tax=unclassified Parafrankia TaxID=2994368 RepID=UPI000DA493DC|nr:MULTISPECIES: RNA polymerase sigma factor [unclassified Parafrankia]SQD96701.1 hypothetical protein FMEAI12_3740016 [Parafrankia sp. Ea1.12]
MSSKPKESEYADGAVPEQPKSQPAPATGRPLDRKANSNDEKARALEPVSLEVAAAVDGTYREHAEHLRAFVRRQMSIHGLSDSQLDAEGVVHEAFTETLSHWGKIDNPAAYLFTIVRRMVGRAAPRAGRVSATDTADLDQAMGRGRSTLTLRATTEDAAAARNVMEAIGRLPDRQGVATYLRHVEGWSQAEIADLLNCAPSTAGVQVHRGVQAVRSRVLFCILRAWRDAVVAKRDEQHAVDEEKETPAPRVLITHLGRRQSIAIALIMLGVMAPVIAIFAGLPVAEIHRYGLVLFALYEAALYAAGGHDRE